MPIVTERFTMFHPPRCGGSWVRAVLDTLGIGYRILGHQHSTPAEYPPDGFSFTLRREPWPWLQSWRPLVESSPQWSWEVPDWLRNATTVSDAEEVMRRYADGVDVVLFTGTLRQDLQGVFDRLGLGVEVPDLPRVNARNY